MNSVDLFTMTTTNSSINFESEVLSKPKIPILSEWNYMNTYPINVEAQPYLLLLPKNSVADFVIVQVSNYQSNAYPDHLDTNIDYDDRVDLTKALMWCSVK